MYTLILLTYLLWSDQTQRTSTSSGMRPIEIGKFSTLDACKDAVTDAHYAFIKKSGGDIGVSFICVQSKER
jgi:hypothetical protein